MKAIYFTFVLCAVLLSGGDATGKEPAPAEPAPAEPAKPAQNVLLITIDTLRPDHLSLYGYERNTSPELRRFFDGHEIWRHAYSAEASTAPSVASILTGRLPQNHGVRLFYQHLDNTVPTLADVLSARGYATGAVVSNVVLTAEALGIDNRFDHYDDFVDEREGMRKIWERRARRTTDAALRWLDEERPAGQPHFLWAHYIDPHGPYTPPTDKPETYDHEGRQPIDVTRVRKYTRLADDPTDGLRYVDRYDEEIAYADREVGRLLRWYEENGLLDETIIVFTADHGESMTDAQWFFAHGWDVVEPVMRVPLAVRRPGGGKAVHENPVSTIDIAPSILHWLAIEPPSDLDGLVLDVRPAEAPVSLEATSHGGQSRAAIVGREKWTLRRNRKGETVRRATIQLPDKETLADELTQAGPESWKDGPGAAALRAWTESDDYPESIRIKQNPGQQLHGPKVAPGVTERQLEGLRALGYAE